MVCFPGSLTITANEVSTLSQVYLELCYFPDGIVIKKKLNTSVMGGTSDVAVRNEPSEPSSNPVYFSLRVLKSISSFPAMDK